MTYIAIRVCETECKLRHGACYKDWDVALVGMCKGDSRSVTVIKNYDDEDRTFEGHVFNDRTTFEIEVVDFARPHEEL